LPTQHSRVANHTVRARTAKAGGSTRERWLGLDAHKDLFALIEARDAAGARALMDDHVKMIRARRVAERDQRQCC